MRPLLALAPLVIALCACAPTQTAGTRSAPLLYNGQTWHVLATTAAGTSVSYTIALDASGGLKSDGTTVYRDRNNRTALFLFPAQEGIRESLAAVYYNTPSRGDIPYVCAVFDPSQAADRTTFQGHFSTNYLHDYTPLSQGKTDGFRTCTLKR